MAHCHACHAHIHLLIFWVVTQQTTTFWGVGPRGGAYDPKFELRRDLCTVHLTAKFHHPTFNGLEIIVLTNKLTNKQTNRRC